MNLYKRMTPPRGLLTAILIGTVLVWVLYAVDPSAWPGRTGAIVQTLVLAGNLVLTTLSRRAKRGVVRLLQRYAVNPAVRALLAVGVNPLGLVVLETTGRRTGVPRRTPVGNGRRGDVLWVIAEHGLQAGYVRNILAEPRVRVRVRLGLRRVWLPGVAEVLAADDALARQRSIVRWHPLRMLNALTVRTLGTDLVTVRIRLEPWPTEPTGAQADVTGTVEPAAPAVGRARTLATATPRTTSVDNH